jgi:alpha-glucosidase
MSVTTARDKPWWRGAVIYQIYPRSFQDSNADGIGDLRGVTERLPYLVELGVDAIWLSPFFRSPMKDFGYDISDYRDVDPIFGTLADFDGLVAAAHDHGLKVLIDQVMSHCADRHPWFVESRSGRDSPLADWFVWADAKPDGSPPNNWLSVFGGSAWEWDTRRGQYYLHNFLAAQPDLNFHNPAVQDATLANLRFWLDRGIDGFRLDAVNFCFHDALLRDNPARTVRVYNPAHNDATPYAWQRHVYDKSRPENLGFLRRIRQLLDEYPGATAVGEIGDDDSMVRVAEYTGGGDKLPMAYSFDLLGPRCDARFLHSVIERFEAAVGDGWACWALSNHDVVRVASRWPAPIGVDADAWLHLVFALELCVRGSPCLYQGEELGLTEVALPFEALQDPLGIRMWPEVHSRDGCRTPMVWDAALPHAGFSAAEHSWLPVAAEHLPRAAALQRTDPASLFHRYRRALAWRRRHPVLSHGTMELLPADDAVVAFIRRDAQGGAAMLCAFNLSGVAAHYTLPPSCRTATPAIPHPLPAATLSGQTLTLPPCGAAFATL